MTKSFHGTRRRFLQLGLSALACGIATPALAMPWRMPQAGIRALSFYNLHTDERLHVDYWRDGGYSRAAMAKIDHVLRDHYSGEVYPMHPRLMDLLHALQTRLGNDGAIEVISGYRSPHTNAMLRRETTGVARNSYHCKGMAIDIRLPGTSLSHLHRTALAMRRGGVGYYPTSDFVHVDVGPVRRW
ncbi:MAG TPA: DUF882 domain-containing protein [Alphaproteobacteria bacterium]|nr:DUF882 domain-containing protein [Alphaproteobacteria bacterium]